MCTLKFEKHWVRGYKPEEKIGYKIAKEPASYTQEKNKAKKKSVLLVFFSEENKGNLKLSTDR